MERTPRTTINGKTQAIPDGCDGQAKTGGNSPLAASLPGLRAFRLGWRARTALVRCAHQTRAGPPPQCDTSILPYPVTFLFCSDSLTTKLDNALPGRENAIMFHCTSVVEYLFGCSDGWRSMGLFYTTFTTRGPDHAKVMTALRDMRRIAFVSPTIERYTVVYDRKTEEQDFTEIEKLGKALSDAFVRTNTGGGPPRGRCPSPLAVSSGRVL